MPIANSVITTKHLTSLHFIFSLHVRVILFLNQRSSWDAHRSLFAVLDPRISYEAMKDEFKNDSDLAVHLEKAKADLQEYFNGNYLSLQASVGNSCRSLAATTSLSSITSSSSSGSPQKIYTARFQRKHTSTDELTEFWNLPQEDFNTCDPLRWWHGRRAQFPQLYHLVRDIFSIPGNYLYPSTPF